MDKFKAACWVAIALNVLAAVLWVMKYCAR